MGGFFGVTSKRDALVDVFFGTDYHSHLGTRRGGVAAFDKEIGLHPKVNEMPHMGTSGKYCVFETSIRL